MSYLYIFGRRHFHGLEVTLEAKIIGKTPLFLDGVKPGTYRLRVKNSKAAINIEPGKTLKISLYKDKFFLIPATDKKPPKQSETVETNRPPSEPDPPPPKSNAQKS